MRVNSVGTAVGDGDGQGDDLLGEQIDLAGPHDGFESRPAKLQVFRMRGQGPPDVGYPVDFLGGFDVLENRSDLGVIGVFVDQFHGAHILHDPQVLGLNGSQAQGLQPLSLACRRFHKSP